MDVLYTFYFVLKKNRNSDARTLLTPELKNIQLAAIEIFTDFYQLYRFRFISFYQNSLNLITCIKYELNQIYYV